MVRSRIRTIIAMLLAMVAGAILSGCNLGHAKNPSFPLTYDQAEQEIDQMESHPKAPVRPVVIAGGWGGTNLANLPVTKALRRALGYRNVIIVTFNGCKTFAECRRRLISGVQRVLPTPDTLTTPPVDVVGVSLGGLVAIDAASPPEDPRYDPRTLEMRNLYAISTPFEGAQMAFFPGSKFLDDMMPNSDYLKRIRQDVVEANYNIVAYGRLGDMWVGTENVQAESYPFYWLPNHGMEDPHHGFNDPRIAADIARRLRHEPSYSTYPPAPLPAYH